MKHEEVVVGWFTLGMIVAGIAQNKNRDGCSWFLLTMHLGPLALFILLCCEKLSNIPSRIEQLEQRLKKLADDCKKLGQNAGSKPAEKQNGE